MNREIIAVYIHPDNGPIKPMSLDIDRVRDAAYRQTMPALEEQARLEEIVGQIRYHFPKIDITIHTPHIRSVMARLYDAKNFSGIVLRLPGRIDEDAQTISRNVEREVEHIRAEFARISSQQQERENEYQHMAAQHKRLQAERDRFRDQCIAQERRIAHATQKEQHMAEQLRGSQERNEHWQQKLAHQKKLYEQSMQEVSCKNVSLEQKYRDVRDQLGDIRKLASQSQRDAEQLQIQNRELEQEIERLKAMLYESNSDPFKQDILIDEYDYDHIDMQ
ncbi:hypothetical protein KDH_12560 [Dictyobacter sp. S3.2.2.5]|uniref:Uncharacterized protein n=2 Tax=Dictyobacter halimunensis TaxID=3026934 RepID=A0ABQ6FPR7_9CHLR|nr:hypothetical protein KDH_12560 [Dictyobacter sp. S3.2.2.5]